MPKRAVQARKPAFRPSRARALTLLGGTRAEILVSLCGERLTALELAQHFGVSSNAIRTHLNALRQADLVGYTTEIRGVGKPTHVYELTIDGQYLLSSAYAPAVDALLHIARAQLGPRADDVVRQAGRLLANGSSARSRPKGTEARAQACAELLR